MFLTYCAELDIISLFYFTANMQLAGNTPLVCYGRKTVRFSVDIFPKI